MKPTTKSANGTSFHGTTITTSVQKLRKILGEPNYSANSGADKVNFEWQAETESGDVFTVYDWKQYKRIGENERVEFHIGGHTNNATVKALDEILKALSEIE
jgi:hypothetical protein